MKMMPYYYYDGMYGYDEEQYPHHRGGEEIYCDPSYYVAMQQ